MPNENASSQHTIVDPNAGVEPCGNAAHSGFSLWLAIGFVFGVGYFCGGC